MAESLENYLSDTIRLLIEEARGSSAKLQRLRTTGPASELEFETGRSFGLFEAVSLLHTQLLGFNLDPTKVGFPADFDPENELIK